MSWRELDAAARETEYSPSSVIGGAYQSFIRSYAQRSRDARARMPGLLNLRYGEAAAARLDLFVPVPVPAARLPPLLLFIHGGYWQELSKEESSFAAAPCVEQGIALAAIDYTLAPHAGVAQMVDECCQALAWLKSEAPRLGFDGQRIVVAGSSAGAHLAAMLALRQPGALKAVVLVSGIYELEPLIGTSINTAVGLTVESARALSPALHQLHGFPPAIVCWGEVETAEFKRQSGGFALQLERAGTSTQQFEVPQRNHFDVVLDIADPTQALGRAVLGRMRVL